MKDVEGSLQPSREKKNNYSKPGISFVFTFLGAFSPPKSGFWIRIP